MVQFAQKDKIGPMISKLNDQKSVCNFIKLCCESGKHELLEALKPEQLKFLSVSSEIFDKVETKQKILKSLLTSGSKVAALDENTLSYALENMDHDSYNKVFANDSEAVKSLKTKEHVKLALLNGPLGEVKFAKFFSAEQCNLLTPKDFDELNLSAWKFNQPLAPICRLSN